MRQELEARTVRTVFVRLMPLLMGCYLLAYLDRINIGFAAVTMNHDLRLDAYHYGLGAGLFFWGYFFFEVPSNLMLQRYGARRWIARIMVTLGPGLDGHSFHPRLGGTIHDGAKHLLIGRVSQKVWLPESDITRNRKWYGRPESLYATDLKTTSVKSAT
jgi:ACS family tartrate transporter-like MFS transporter